MILEAVPASRRATEAAARWPARQFGVGPWRAEGLLRGQQLPVGERAVVKPMARATSATRAASAG